jgi:hypothetical protein
MHILLAVAAAAEAVEPQQCVYQRNAGRYRESGCLTPGVQYCGADPLPTNGNIECFAATPLDEVMRKCDSHANCVGFSFGVAEGALHKTGCLKNNYLSQWCNEPGAPAPCGAGVYDGYDKGRYVEQPYATRKASGRFEIACTCGPCPVWGNAFLLVAMGAAAVYLIAGMVYGRKSGREGSGLRSHPHWEAWGEVRSLCLDGIALVQARGQKPLGEGGARGGQLRQPLTGAGRAPSANEEKKEKKEKKERKSEETKKLVASVVQIAGASSGSSSSKPAMATPTVTTSVVDTAAGGGGRWVHLPTT